MISTHAAIDFIVAKIVDEAAGRDVPLREASAGRVSVMFFASLRQDLRYTLPDCTQAPLVSSGL